MIDKLFSFRYRFVKSRLHAYLNGECSAMTRRYISYHIDHDVRCYQEYVYQRDFQRTLENEIPRIGVSSQMPDFDQLWSGISTQLNTNTAPIPQLKKRYSLGYTMTILALLFLLFPQSTRIITASDIPDHPSPQPELLSITPIAQNAIVMISWVNTPPIISVTPEVSQTRSQNAPAIRNTPEPEILTQPPLR